MGTNFYFIVPAVTLPTGEVLHLWKMSVMREHPAVHIGKRSAAGPYCWDCNTTLCVQGNAGIHAHVAEWHACCPKCGQVRDETGLGQSAALELGFKTMSQMQSKGVRSCSSFRWGIPKDVVFKTCQANLETGIIQDEYDRVYTGTLFLKMLDACPIEFESIGQCFS